MLLFLVGIGIAKAINTYVLNDLRVLVNGTTSSTDPVALLAGQVSYTTTGQLAGLAIGGVGAKASVPTPVFSTTLGYDGLQRPVTNSATRAGASTPFWSQTRTLDNDGNVLQLATTLPTTGGGSLTDTQSFCYDALNRLAGAANSGVVPGGGVGGHCGARPSGSTTPGYAQSYSYDALDRLIQGPSGTLGYTDPTHVHAATTLSTVPNQYASYDAMGNMTCRTTDTTGSQSCAAGAQTGAAMSYDNEGRLATWTAPTGLSETDQSLYDNEGNRVLTRSSTTANGATTTSDTITFDNLTEVDITGGTSTVTNYYSVAGQRVAQRKGAILSYLLPDFLGSDSIALNADGSVQAVQLFAPYGSVRYSDQVMPTDYSFTGQRLDQRSGLLYDNARYYDPVSGRFTRADTVQTNTTGSDPYAYAGESPETMSDPSGNIPVCSAGPEGCDQGGTGGTGRNEQGGGGSGGGGSNGGGSGSGGSSGGGSGDGISGSGTGTVGRRTGSHKRLSPNQLDNWCAGNISCQNTLEAYYEGEDAAGTFNALQWGAMFFAFFDGDPEEIQQTIEADTLSMEYGLGDGEFDSDILAKLESSDPGDQAEGQAAGIANKYSTLIKMNYKYGQNGSLGEVDAETPDAIIEAKTGNVRIPKLKAQFNNPDTNPDGKPFIIYGPDWGPKQAMTIYENLGSLDSGQSVYVVTSQEQLIEVLQYLQEP